MHLHKRYHYPPFSILSDPETTLPPLPVSGDDLAQLLSRVSPCHCIHIQRAPQLATYHMALEDPFALPRIKRAIPALSAALHTPINMAHSDCANFALQAAFDHSMPISFASCTKRVLRQNSKLLACLGVDQSGDLLSADLAAMPHTLIAGATGSGKSVLLNSIIGSLCMHYTPNQLRFVMIDPKQVELSRWSPLRDFLHVPVITDTGKAVAQLEALCALMDARYRTMKQRRVNDGSGLFPRLVVVIDELADLMLTSRKAVESSIVRIAQLGRAAGIHLLLATQRPTANVVTGLIKANVLCRIALKVASSRDSLVILDHSGAEKLIGRGDALVRFPDRVEDIRFQAPFISSSDIAAIADWWSHEPNRR